MAREFSEVRRLHLPIGAHGFGDIFRVEDRFPVRTDQISGSMAEGPNIGVVRAQITPLPVYARRALKHVTCMLPMRLSLIHI